MSRGHTLHFCSQVTSDVLQHYGPRLGVGGEIPLQRSNLPTHRDHDFKVFGIAWQYRWGGGY
jgi:hypothetical protein